MCSDLLVNDTVGVDEDCSVLRRVVHGFAVEADEIEKGRYVGGGGGAWFKHDPRPERWVVVAGCDESVWGRCCAIRVFTGDEAVGCGRRGVYECEAREGEVGIVGQVAGTVRGGDFVKLWQSVRKGRHWRTSELSGQVGLLSGFG